MITKDTHSIDWNKTAQATGVVVLTLGKGIWWLAKRGGLLLIAILTVLAKVFVAILSVWATLPPTVEEEVEHDLSRAPDPNEPGFDILGRPIRHHF